MAASTVVVPVHQVLCVYPVVTPVCSESVKWRYPHLPPRARSEAPLYVYQWKFTNGSCYAHLEVVILIYQLEDAILI